MALGRRNARIEAAVLDDGLLPVPVHAERIEGNVKYRGVVESHNLGPTALESGGVQDHGPEIVGGGGAQAGPEAPQGDVRLRVEASIRILGGRTQIQVDAAGVVAAVRRQVVDEFRTAARDAARDEAGHSGRTKVSDSITAVSVESDEAGSVRVEKKFFP